MMAPQLSAEKRAKLVDRLEQMKVHELPELKPALQARACSTSETSCPPPATVEVSNLALTFARMFELSQERAARILDTLRRHDLAPGTRR